MKLIHYSYLFKLGKTEKKEINNLKWINLIYKLFFFNIIRIICIKLQL